MSSDPEEKIIAGMTRGTLQYFEEKISSLITRFKNKDITFVEEIETANLAKEQRKKPEWELFKQYVYDYDLRILFQLGLTFRSLENQGKPIDVLKKNVKDKYGSTGLHIAYFVQNGFFQRLLASIVERERTPEALRKEISDVLRNIENVVTFITGMDSKQELELKATRIITKINANSPKTYIISSAQEKGKSGSATKKCAQVYKMVMEGISGYSVEFNKTETREIYFLNKEE